MTGAADAGGGMRGKTGTRMFLRRGLAGMTPKGDFPPRACDTIPNPEKWPSG